MGLGWSSRPLALPWSGPGYCGHLGRELRDRDPSFLSLSNDMAHGGKGLPSAIQINQSSYTKQRGQMPRTPHEVCSAALTRAPNQPPWAHGQEGGPAWNGGAGDSGLQGIMLRSVGLVLVVVQAPPLALSSTLGKTVQVFRPLHPHRRPSGSSRLPALAWASSGCNGLWGWRRGDSTGSGFS